MTAAAVATLLMGAGDARAQTETTPPVLDVATLSPTPATGHNGWYRTSPVTLNMTASDASGIDRFEYAFAAAGPWTPVAAVNGAGSVAISQQGLGNNAVRYRAIDAAGNVSAVRQTSIRIDTVPPTATWPMITDGRVGHATRLIPTRTDPSPGPGFSGSGGVAVQEMYLDGEWVYPLPITTTDLSLGAHEITMKLGDAAGNAQLQTTTFVVTTSYADVESIIATYLAANRITQATADALRAQLALAQGAAGKKAKPHLNAFVSIAQDQIADNAARATLAADGRHLIDAATGALPADPPTGTTFAPADGPPIYRDPVLAPLPHDPEAKFDVLVYSETTGFRHDHIPHTIKAIQEMGAEHGFNVDVYDPQLPTVTLPASPFLSLETLREYETIVFDSTVGHNPGPLDPVTERPVFEAYMAAGGGYVGLHGAADSARGSAANQWAFYGNLVGGWFTNHPNGQNGFGHCGSCINAEVVTEDSEHPATAHLAPTWPIVDELYNFDRAIRGDVHTLLSLDEASYQRSLNSGNAANNPLVLMPGGDHPIAWCQNYGGGKAFSNILGHARWLYYDPSFLKILRGGIETTAGAVPAYCGSFRETALLVSGAASAGSLTPDAAAGASALLEAAKAAYLEKRYADAIPALNAVADLASDAASGDAATRAELGSQARGLREWMQQLNRG
ncbi:MAG: ThuA domain-containing protein [Solirubrobacteraceae bacterium]